MRQIICIILFSVATLNIFAQNCLDDLDILFMHDFENNTLGTYLKSEWKEDWLNPQYPYLNRQETTKIIVDGNNIQNNTKTLNIDFPKGSVGPSQGGCQWETKLNFGNEVYVSYDLLFMPGFKFKKGGKLPSAKGKDVTSGKKPTGYDGFTSGLMFNIYNSDTNSAFGEIRFYLYFPDQISNYGDVIVWGHPYDTPDSRANFSDKIILEYTKGIRNKCETGRWYNLTYRVVLNTITQVNSSEQTGNYDGIIEGYFDGELVMQLSHIRFRNADTVKLNCMRLYTFFGGAAPTFANPIDEWLRVDNFLLYTFKNGVDVPRGNTLSPTTRRINYWRNFIHQEGSLCGNYTSTFNNLAAPLKAITINSCTETNGAQINNGAVVVAQATNQIVLNPGFVADAGSNFTAEIVTSSCSTISKAAEENEEGIISDPVSESIISDINIYPNPNQGQFSIRVNSDAEAEYSIFNNLGQQLTKSKFNNQANIDLSNQPAGLYFVTVKLNEKTYNEKIIVQ